MRYRLNLKRRTSAIRHGDLDELILSKKQHYAQLMGIRRLTYHLRTHDHVWVSCDAVHESLKVVDAEGLKHRRKQKLSRRIFHSDGPNQVWSLDGHDKLSRWGFPIHGCIDGYSRYLLWLETGASNHDPRYILSWYLNAIEEVANESGTGIRISIHGIWQI